jgi:carbonic anhydrase
VSGDEYLSFTDIDQSLRDDVARLRDVKTLPDGVTVSGSVYDVRTGQLREVDPA